MSILLDEAITFFNGVDAVQNAQKFFPRPGGKSPSPKESIVDHGQKWLWRSSRDGVASGQNVQCVRQDQGRGGIFQEAICSQSSLAQVHFVRKPSRTQW